MAEKYSASFRSSTGRSASALEIDEVRDAGAKCGPLAASSSWHPHSLGKRRQFPNQAARAPNHAETCQIHPSKLLSLDQA